MEFLRVFTDTMNTFNYVITKDEDLYHYKRIVEKYGDVKRNIVLLLHEKKLKEITELWNMIRTEARYVVTFEVFKENAEFYFYCGQTLQKDIIHTLQINGCNEKDYNEITDNLN